MGISRPTNPTATPATGGGGSRRAGGTGRSSNSTFVESLAAAWGIPELRRRIQFVFAMFAVYTCGLHIPLPDVNHEALSQLFKSGAGILSMIDVFTGGALKNFTVFAMGIVPYINASIIMQLLTFAIPQWQELSREGETGRKRIAQYTRYLTVALAIVQSIGIIGLLHRSHVIPDNWALYVHIVFTLVAGTSFLMWLGEMITDKGIGNGVSLIIFCGIMVRLPSQLVLLGQSLSAGTVSALNVLVLAAAFFGTVIGIVYVTLGQRRVPIQHVRRIVGNKMTQGGMSYLPFRVNSAGVIPIIFAISIVLLPLTISSYLPDKPGFGHFIHLVSENFKPGTTSWGSWISSAIYALFVIGFTYFYMAIQMDIPHIAGDLRKYGSYIPGVRPGKPTEEYLDRVLSRITMAGSLFLALVALLNYWVPEWTHTQGSFTLVGGTSLLIVVTVALDTMQAIEAQLLMRHYEGFIR